MKYKYNLDSSEYNWSISRQRQKKLKVFILKYRIGIEYQGKPYSKALKTYLDSFYQNLLSLIGLDQQ